MKWKLKGLGSTESKAIEQIKTKILELERKLTIQKHKSQEERTTQNPPSKITYPKIPQREKEDSNCETN